MSLLWISAEQCVEKGLASVRTTYNKKVQWTIEYMALVVGMNQSTPSRNDFLFNNWG